MATLGQTLRNTLQQTAIRIRHYRQLCATQISRFAAWCAQLLRRSLTIAQRSAVRILQDFRTGVRALRTFASNLWIILQEFPSLLWSGIRRTYQLLRHALAAGCQFINTISPIIARALLTAFSHIIGLIVGVCAAILDVIAGSVRFLAHLVIRSPATVNAPARSPLSTPLAQPKNKTNAKSVAKSPVTQQYHQARSPSQLQAMPQATKRRLRPAR